MNQSLFQFVHRFAGRWVFLDDLGIFFAQYVPYLMVAVFLVLIYYQEGTRRKVFLFCEGVLAIILSRGIITEVLHFFVHHARPFLFYNFTPLIADSGWSLPSGHAAWFFALSMTVWYANRQWGAWFFVLSAIMGIARIYAGVHWPLDILAGAAIGIASGMFVHWLLRDARKKLSKADIGH